METVWKAIVAAYKRGRVGVQYTNLSVGSFCNKDKPFSHYPKLKGKGAEVRDLVWPLHQAWVSMMSNTAHHRRIAKVLQLQVDIQSILHEHRSEVFLPGPAIKEFRKLVHELLREYSLLANQADRDGKFLWSVVVKHHYLHHMADRAAHLNPRKGNTMIDEDFVGQAKDLVAACSHGTESHCVPEKFLERYLWGKYIILKYGP